MFKRFVLPLISGIIVGLSFYDGALFLLAPIGLFGFFYVLLNAERGFLVSFIFGAGFYLTLISWSLRFNLSWLGIDPVTVNVLRVLMWIAISAVEAVLLGFFGKAVVALCGEKKMLRPLIVTAVWVLLEIVAGLSASALGFSWGRIAASQYTILPMIQSASVFGSLFVSGIIVYFSASAALSFIERSPRPLVPALCAVVVNLSYGAVALNVEREGTPYTVGVVQGGLGSSGQWRMGGSEILGHYLKLCDASSGELLVLPESAISVTLNKSTLLDQLKNYCIENDRAMLVGGFYDEGDKSYGAAYLIDKDGECEVYKKQHLVPFGEYVPLRNSLEKLFPSLFEKRNLDSNLAAGGRQPPMEAGGIKIGAVLCFDSIFATYTRYSTHHGAQLLCVSTNDSWFLGNLAKRQHLSQSVLRAVENGRYVVRSASNGISAVIDDTGHILSRVEHDGADVFDADVKIIDKKTPYTYVGDLPMLLFAFVVSVWAIVAKREKS